MPTGRSLAEVLEGSILGGHRMSNRARRNGKALSLLIVWSIALGGIFAVTVSLSPAARAGPCDQVGVISGDWTITTAQVCTGITFTVDGSININSGGSLRLVNGGLSFSKDAAHAGYALNVNAGGALILDNSIVTTQTTAINPYLKLALTVSGAGSQLVLMNGAKLKFPGWFNATGASVNVTDSTITGFTTQEISSTGLDTELNDDSPIITWASTTATLFHSTIDRVYQDGRFSEGSRPGGSLFNVSLTASSTLYAYDTYLSVDYSNVVGLHNELHVDGTSSAYLYNVTIDRTQDPLYLSNWTSAFVPTAAGGSINLFRWLRASVVDRTSFAIAGATIWSASSPTGATAQYPDNGASTTPSARTLWYLGRGASGVNAWNRTDLNGVAKIPLYTDQITSATLPNGQSFGNYQETVTYSTSTVTGGAFFNPYPAVSAADNNQWSTYPFDLQVRTLPDLELRPSDYTSTMNVIQNQPFAVVAKIYNRGQTDASAVSIAAYLNGDLANQLARVNNLNVAQGAQVNQSLSINGLATIGPQRIMLVVDPSNSINEGGPGRMGCFGGNWAGPDGRAGRSRVSGTPPAGSIPPQTQSITITKPVPFLNRTVPIPGLPYWLFFIILAAAAAAVIGVTLYWKIYGLGKMVECGECGAFIPEDATSCPKCGVEFEKDMAKCSNCQAWIPGDVKQCPEGGVEFATGQVEMADYQEKMRLQYDEVVTKFKEEASRQLGRALSDREFQEWWRKQPTFVTFEDWLREEEEMRKMGSKPCPTCGTLNSVTATVCHKCGSLMRETTRPPSGGGGGGSAPVIQARRPGGSPGPEGSSGGQAASFGGGPAGAPSGTEAIPRRVIRKPVAPQPVVQKKVIKKPSDGGEGGDGQSESSGDTGTEDEL